MASVIVVIATVVVGLLCGSFVGNASLRTWTSSTVAGPQVGRVSRIDRCVLLCCEERTDVTYRKH